MAIRRAVLLLIAGATLVRLWLANATGLGIDESYMVGNARQLAAGYVDHPPLHVWIVWAAVHLFGSEAASLSACRSCCSSPARRGALPPHGRLFGARGIRRPWPSRWRRCSPLADATWVLPDGPMIFFLLAAAKRTARTRRRRRQSRDRARIAGALGGRAVEVHGSFFFPAVLAFCSPGARHHGLPPLAVARGSRRSSCSPVLLNAHTARRHLFQPPGRPALRPEQAALPPEARCSTSRRGWACPSPSRSLPP